MFWESLVWGDVLRILVLILKATIRCPSVCQNDGDDILKITTVQSLHTDHLYMNWGDVSKTTEH